MKLYDKLNIASNEKLGMSYDAIICNPHDALYNLLKQYDIDYLIDIKDSLRNLEFDRVIHIINLYFFGDLFFKDLISTNLNHQMSTTIHEWELLSLVHDISYIYETVSFSQQYLDLQDVCSKLNLTPFFLKLKNNVFYSPETYNNYFKYKREHFGVCDHGILAGILFENKYPNTQKINKLDLSYVIASHNIFVANRNNVPLYKAYKLFELIPDSPVFNCIVVNQNKYSFFYLLFCLLDILEPINAFNCMSADEVRLLLNSINFEVIDNNLVVSAMLTSQIETIAHRIFDIPIWLRVGLNIKPDKKIIISAALPK